VSSLAAVCLRESGWLIDLTRALAGVESPSTDREALEACAALLCGRLAAAGAAVSRLEAGAAAPHVLAEWPGHGPDVLLLGHYDTVWPVGQLERMPIREADGKLFGPGIYDMKAGLAIGALAARAVVETLALARRPRLRLLATADEEVGSATSRAIIERLARESAAVLVLEPALPGGRVKTARKGVGEFAVTTRGISAHAGADPAAGASAVHELARQIVAIEGLADPALGRSVNVGRVEGGTRSNVVAESATAIVDVRVSRLDDAPVVEAAFAALRPANPRVRLEISGGINRPPMERTAGVGRLFDLARDAARELGRELGEGATGGASDGNFTAALGIPTLDGLGAVGDGAHALHEHVVVSALPGQAALVAALLSRLVDNGIGSRLNHE
jgi:glutamate carboxypeptidase